MTSGTFWYRFKFMLKWFSGALVVFAIFIGFPALYKCMRSWNANTEPRNGIHAESHEACVKYDGPQDSGTGHYLDDRIHLVPLLTAAQKTKGYIVVYMPEGSPFLKRGLQTGDVITEVDRKTSTEDLASNRNDFFDKIKTVNFKTLTVERCQRILIR